MKLNLIVPVIVCAAAPAAAQPVEHPSQIAPGPEATQLELAVDITSAGEIDAEAVGASLAGELGVTIVAQDAFAPALGRLSIEVAAGVLRITYQPAQGERLTREVALPAAQSDRIQLIGFLATNLVRDQVSAALAGMPPPAPPAPTPVVVVPPPPTPVVTPPRPRERVIPATIGFVPPLAVDRISGGEVSVGFGIHAVMGMTDSSRIASISGAVDVQRRAAYGLQIGGAATIAGREVRGAQIAGAVAVTRHLHGAQIAGAAAAAETVDGAQIAGAINVARDTNGLQIAGALNVARDVDGAQIAGAINVGRDVHGAQIGVLNVARRMRGLQLGVINVSDDGDDAYPIGLLNFARNGRVEADGWVESNKLTGVALRHGPRHIHNLVGLAWTPDHDHILAGFGLGFHHALSSGPRPVTLDVDAVNWWTNVWEGELGQLEQLRLTVAVPIGGIDLFAGAAANVYITDEMDESANFHPVMARRVTSDTGIHVVSWPSVFAGVRLHAR